MAEGISSTTEQKTNLTPAPTKTAEPALTATPESSTAKTGGFSEFLQRLLAFGWRGWLLVAVLVGLYAPVLSRLVRQWYEDPDYSHGFLVPLLSAYLIWQRRDKLAAIVRKPSNWGLVIVVFSLGLLFLGSLGAELFLTRVSIVLTICGLIAYFSAGISAVRHTDSCADL
jgi:preprotein translocase subunit SecG